MTPIAAPQPAPPRDAMEAAAYGSEEMPAGGASRQPFEDYLDETQGGKQANGSNSPYGQSEAHGKTVTAPAAALAAIVPPPAAPRKPAPKAREPSTRENPAHQQSPLSQEAAATLDALPRAAMTIAPAMTISPMLPAAPIKGTPKTEEPARQAAAGQQQSQVMPEAALAAAPAQTVATLTPPTPLAPSVVNPESGAGIETARSALAWNFAGSHSSPAPTKSPAVASGAPPETPARVESSGPEQQPAATPQQQPAGPKIQAAETFDPLSDPGASAAAATLAAASSNAAFRPNGLPLSGAAKGANREPAEIAAARQNHETTRGGERISQAPYPAKEALQDGTATSIGTVVAKQVRAMERASQFQTEPPVPVFTAAAAGSERAPQGPGTAAAKSNPAYQPHDSQEPSVSAAPAMAFSISNSAASAGKVSPGNPAAAMPEQGFASTTLNQVMESADKMTSDGKTRVEMQVNLDDGQQITVRLQMTQGSLHPIFKTESPELRQAIEQNWAGFRSGASERGLQISAPVFESPGSEGGFDASGSRNQSYHPDGDPSDAESRETSTPPVLRNDGNPAITAPLAAAATVGSSVQMYA